MKYFVYLFISCLLITSCDDGDIYPKEPGDDSNGRILQTEISFTGIKSWPTESTIVFAAFGEDERYPLVSKTIEKSVEGASTAITLKNVPRNAKYASVCIIEKGRKLSYSFSDFELTGEETTVTIPAQTINLLTYPRIQKQVFSQCIACHGGGASTAADLYLTEGKSYHALVNIHSSISDKKLVDPGFINSSFLIDILKSQSGLKYDHTSISSFKDDDMSLLETWIEAGAKNE